MALAYLVSEWRIRRETRWKEGPLNALTLRIAAMPFLVYVVGAVILSTGGWSILNLTSFLVIVALPLALAGAVRWFRPEERASVAQLVALSLSLLGLTAVWLG